MRHINKKGFTLVELLAVIAIVAILLLLVVPAIITLFNNGRKDAFATEVQGVWKIAEQQYVQDSFNSSGLASGYYTNAEIEGLSAKSLDVSDSDATYYVHVNENSQVDQIAVSNGNYCYVANADATININREDVGDNNDKTISCNFVSGIVLCTCDSSDITSNTNTYTVSVSISGGSVAGSSSKTVYEGASAVFAITANTGYNINGATVTSGDCRLFQNVLFLTNVTENSTCSVNIPIKTYNVGINVNNTNYGSVTVSSNTLNYNGSISATITPVDFYKIKSVTCTNGYTLSNFTANKKETQTITINNNGVDGESTCTFTFEEATCTVYCTAGGNCTKLGSSHPSGLHAIYTCNGVNTINTMESCWYGSTQCDGATAGPSKALYKCTSNDNYGLGWRCQSSLSGAPSGLGLDEAGTYSCSCD